MTKSPSPSTADYRDKIIGIASACFAFFLLSIMLGTSKLLKDEHHVIEIVFYRNAIPAFFLGLAILAKKRRDLFIPEKPFLLSARVLVGTVGLFATFSAVQFLPLSNATVLFFVSTLLIPVFAHFFLKEKIGKHRWAAIFIGMLAVILIAKPSTEVTLIGVVIALTAALAHATIQILLRALRGENAITVTFYFLFGGALAAGLFMPFLANTPTYKSIIYLLIVAGTGGFAQYFLTNAFKRAPASLISPFNYTGLIWTSGFDIFIFGIIPGWNVYVGATIMLAAQIYIILRERRVARELS